MNKLLLPLLCLSLLFAPSASAQNNKKVKRQKRSIEACPVYNHVMSMDLSHVQVSSNCDDVSDECSGKTTIDIKLGFTFPNDRYQYTVSGGKVAGDGPEAKWDLSGVPPGKYMITAAARQEYDRPPGSDIISMGRTYSKIIEILDCADCQNK